MNCNNVPVSSKSDIHVKTENDFVVDILEVKPVKTECHQNLSDEEIIDSNLETVVKTEIDEEIENFDFTENYDLPEFIGEKRKNKEIAEIEPKKFKEEFVVFEESYDDQPKIEQINGEPDDKVFLTKHIVISNQAKIFTKYLL